MNHLYSTSDDTANNMNMQAHIVSKLFDTIESWCYDDAKMPDRKFGLGNI